MFFRSLPGGVFSALEAFSHLSKVSALGPRCVEQHRCLQLARQPTACLHGPGVGSPEEGRPQDRNRMTVLALSCRVESDWMEIVV